VLELAGLQVGFDRLDDRFGHWIAVAEGNRWRRVLESCEGTGQQHWPASPPLQELHVEPRGAGREVALLVGQAGAGHWSLSVELDRSGAARENAEQLFYEAACRLQRPPPGWLGTSYRLVGDLVCRIEPAACRLLWAGGSVQLEALASGECPAARWTLADGVLALQPEPAVATWPATVRWRYCLEPRAWQS
jgi:hypothetical protein